MSPTQIESSIKAAVLIHRNTKGVLTVSKSIIRDSSFLIVRSPKAHGWRIRNLTTQELTMFQTTYFTTNIMKPPSQYL